MAKLKQSKFIQELIKDVKKELAKAGINSNINSEAVKGTRLYRLYIVAPKFKNLKHSERQDLIWRIIGGILSADEQLRISMILTLTPDEMGWVKERTT